MGRSGAIEPPLTEPDNAACPLRCWAMPTLADHRRLWTAPPRDLKQTSAERKPSYAPRSGPMRKLRGLMATALAIPLAIAVVAIAPTAAHASDNGVGQTP